MIALALAPGTPCFLVNLVQMRDLVGRVVEVAAPIPTPDGEAGPWYTITSDWARAMFPGAEMQAPRRHLLPIYPPALLASRKRVREPARQC